MAKIGAMAAVIAAMLTIFVGGLLVNEFEGVIDDMRVGASADFNDTMDRVETFTWIGFTFFAIGILVMVGSWILRMVGGLGGLF